MGAEKNTWNNLKKVLDTFAGVHYQRFEDSLASGIPDCMICDVGVVIFAELKYLDCFPVRPSTPVRVDFRRNQYNWIYFHQKAGGNAILVIQIGREYFVFDRLDFMEKICNEEWNQSDFRSFGLVYSNAKSVVEAILRMEL